MKELKFRAWDKFNEDLIHSNNFDYLFLFFIEVQKRIDGGNDIQFLRCIGRKDKNGKYLFEDDIVVKKGMNNYSDEYQEWMSNENFSHGADDALHAKIPLIDEVTDVVTMERFPVYWLKNESFGYEGEDLEDPEKFEVIGNIHQNPELIK